MSSRRTRMKRSRHRGDPRAWLLPAALLAACASSAAAAAGSCVLARLAELPVTTAGARPLVHAAINATDGLSLAHGRGRPLFPAPAVAGALNTDTSPPSSFHADDTPGA